MGTSTFQKLLLGLIYGVGSLFSRTDQTAIMISPHYSVLEPDVQQLLRRLPERTDRTIYVAVDPTHSSASTEEVQSLFENDPITVVDRHSRAFRRALRRSQVVILKSPVHLHSYRFFDPWNSQTYLVFAHGIITKAYGRHRTNSSDGSWRSRLKDQLTKWYLYSSISYQGVSSEVEAFYRASAEGRHPKSFKEYGYPRYDRIKELVTENEASSISPEVARELESADTLNLLYAPTHKDGAYDTTLFPFEDFDNEQLIDFLQDHNIRLYLRMHPREADHPQLTDLVNGEEINEIGVDEAPSAVELFPYIDVVMTDYSSIYMDFLPFNRPIIFVHDRLDKFESIRGIAFDYDRYFPGRTIDSFATWQEHVSRIIETGDDGYEDERRFVQQVLLPERETSCIDSILTHLK